MTNDAAAGAEAPAVSRQDPPMYQVRIWPHRSLSDRGFVWIMAGTGGMLCLPLVPMLRTPVALGLAPFLALTLAALGWFMRRNARDLTLSEELRLWPDLIAVERRDPRGAVQRWQANPYWVKLTVHPDGRPENYLTLKGGGREIELGAFLSPEERLELAKQLEAALADARRSPGWGPQRGE